MGNAIIRFTAAFRMALGLQATWQANDISFAANRFVVQGMLTVNMTSKEGTGKT